MAVPWGLAGFVLGILYGWSVSSTGGVRLAPAMLLGALLGVVMVVVGWLLEAPALGWRSGPAMVASGFILLLLFMAGVWVGGLVGAAIQRARA